MSLKEPKTIQRQKKSGQTEDGKGDLDIGSMPGSESMSQIE